MPKPRLLTASECARLTGITVKALRVYERMGLVAPARSAKGYRLYGQKELVRLNAIATLKSVGLTLAQIRDAFETSSPRLSRILQMQLGEWRARRAAAEKAIEVVQAALVRVSARETLSIEELCQLIRSIEMSNVQQITRTLINEALTPEEERAWTTYYAGLPPEKIAENRQHHETARAITEELVRLMNQGADPASAEVQALIERSNEHLLNARFREEYFVRLQWNAPVTRKLLKLGQRLVITTSLPAGADTEAMVPKFQRFMAAAHRASRVGRAMEQIFRDVKVRLGRGEKADASEAKEVAARFAQLCSQHQLGDPQVYARWHLEFGDIIEDPELAKEYGNVREMWEFLADAVRAMGP
jgi:MerR family transcriptional regulator, thiopeptide resistance regulator